MADTNGEADIWMNACRHDDPAIKVTAFVLKDLSYDLLIGTESLIRLGLLAKGWPNVRPRSMEREEEREKPRRRESGWMTREDGVMTDAAKCTPPTEPTILTSYSNSSESDSDNETEDANGFVIIPKWKDFTTLDGPSYPRDQTKITRYHFSK